MKKIIIIILSVLLITACADRTYNYEIEGHMKACANKSGLAYINNLNGRATCKDGSSTNWRSK